LSVRKTGIIRCSIYTTSEQYYSSLSAPPAIRQIIQAALWNSKAFLFGNLVGLFKYKWVSSQCGAIDGTIIEIERPHDYEGWYFRKLYHIYIHHFTILTQIVAVFSL
jgi:hypothetical protein